eukprot:403358619
MQEVQKYGEEYKKLRQDVWRNKLEVGQIIYIQRNKNELPKKAQINRWVQSENERSDKLSHYHNTIIEVKYFKENQIDLEYEESELVGKWSSMISQHRLLDEKLDSWKQNLKIGMKLLAYYNECWHPSYIKDAQYKNEDEVQETKSVQIAFRFYHLFGNFYDEEG